MPIGLHILRHILQKCSSIHQVLTALFVSSNKKSVSAYGHLELCGIALKLKETLIQ
jgi:hypothetical protein